MFPRRVTRSATRAAAAAANHPAPAPTAPVPVPAPPAAVPSAAQTTSNNNPAPVRTRSGRVVRQIASTVQKLTGGRGGRKAAEQDAVESQASTSKAPARPSTTAPPPRKRSRKDAPAATTSTTDAPVEAPATTSTAPRKRAPKRQAAAKTRGRSKQGAKAKASLPAPSPAPEAARTLADTPAAQPKAVEDYDALTSAIKEFNNTTLAADRLKREPVSPYKAAFNLPAYLCVHPKFNFFDPAFRLVIGRHSSNGVQRGADSGYDTDSQDGPSHSADDGEGTSSKSSAQSGTDVGKITHNPIVFPTPEPREEVQVPTRFPPPGATMISRQNAYVFDRRGRPLPTGRGEPGIPQRIGDEVATLLKSWRGPPYPANWHGPMFEEELELATSSDARPGLLTRQYAVNMGYPDDDLELAPEFEPTVGSPPRALLARPDPATLDYPDEVPMPGPSPLALSTADAADNTVSTHEYGYKPVQEEPIIGRLLFRDMVQAQVVPDVDTETPLVTPLVSPATSPSPSPEPVDPEEAERRQRREEMIKKHKMQPLRRQSHIIIERQQRLQEEGIVSPRHGESVDDLAPSLDSPGPSTAPRPRPPPGRELRRHHAVLIDEKGREIPIRADDASGNGSNAPIGLLVASTLQQMDMRAAESSQTQPQPKPRRFTTPAVEAAAAKLAALTRTPSQNSLSLLSTPRKSKPIPFSREGSQAPLGSKESSLSAQSSLSSISESAEPAGVDKGKGRALPEPEPERQNAPSDKGKKRAREEDQDEGSSESSEGDLDEVEASLVIDLDEDEDDVMADDSEEQAFSSDWPRNYVVRKSLFRIEVSMLPMPHLPVAPPPKNGEPVIRYIGPQGTQPPTILSSGSKRARDEDDVPEDVVPRAKKVRTASQ